MLNPVPRTTLCERVRTERALRAAHSEFANDMNAPSTTVFVISIERSPSGSAGSFVGSPIATWPPEKTDRAEMEFAMPT